MSTTEHEIPLPRRGERAVSGATVWRRPGDLLGWPLLGALLRSKAFRNLLQGGSLLLLLLAVGFGLALPDERHNHVTTGILWGLFWPFLVILTLPTLGRVVCLACPHGFLGRLLTPLGLRRKAPAWLRTPWWGLGLLIASYWVVFYAWEPFDDPLLTAVYFLIWTLLAVIGFALLDGMAWCKFLCPIGAILTAFSKVSFTWLGSERGACESCRTFDCAKACSYRLSPFNFDRKGSMEDCTLCLECASACPSIRWRLTRPGHGVLRALSRPRMEDVWVYVLLLGVITMTMHFHHGLSRSAIADRMPWNRLAAVIDGHLPLLHQYGVHGSGLLALLMATALTLVAGFGGLAAAGRVLGMERGRAIRLLGYGLAPLMIVGGLSHVTEFFFLHYYHQVGNAFIQLLGLDHPWLEPLARHGEPWLRVFSVFKYAAFVFSLWLTWRCLRAAGATGRRLWLAFPLASLMAWVYLASVLFNSYVFAVYGAAPHHPM